jgi:hypothetical protein
MVYGGVEIDEKGMKAWFLRFIAGALAGFGFCNEYA